MRETNKKRVFFVLALLLLTQFASAQEAEEIAPEVSAIDTMWVLLAAFLVFFMQAGFALVEAGLTRAKNVGNIMMKNLMDLSMGSIGYFIAGFGIMFGAGTAFYGTEYFFLGGANFDGIWDGLSIPGYAFWIFQAVFAATAATIVSGVVAERTKFISYLVYSFIISLIIYPLVGHWIWGGGWLTTGDVLPFLGDVPFMDFAGSTVVHSLGAWIGLAAAIVLGPRIGKYDKQGRPRAIPGHNIAYAIIGVFFLWFGWFGFNPGSSLTGMDGSIARIAVTTNLAAAAGAIAAMTISWLKFGKPDVGMTGNGALAGLVAITAGCAAVSPASAIVIGLIAGVIVVYAVAFFDTIRIDDPVGAISVHGVCGAFGTIAVGLFAEVAYTGGASGLFFGGGVDQLVTQIVGVTAVFVYALAAGLVMFKLIDITIGMRVSPEEEIKGLDYSEHRLSAYPDFTPTYDPLRR